MKAFLTCILAFVVALVFGSKSSAKVIEMSPKDAKEIKGGSQPCGNL